MKEATDSAVRLAVIGAGLIGKKHAALIKDLPEACLVAISDVDTAVRRYSEELGVAFFEDYSDMLCAVSPDGVIVATPTESHATVGMACARQGVHMLVEKPIAHNLHDARLLVDCAGDYHVHLLIGHHRRHNPLVQAAREAVAGGQIGRLVAVNVLWMLKKPDDYYQVAWRCQSGGGPFLINLIHDIDNLRYICGEIQRVYAETSSAVRRLAVEDSGSLCLRFTNGAVGTLLVSDCTPSKWSFEQSTGENPFYFRTNATCYHFFGTKGSLAFPDMNLVYYENDTRAGWQYPLASRNFEVQSKDPLVEQIKHFCKVIKGREAPKITGEDGLRTLAVLLGALDSGKNGEPAEFAWK